MRNKEKSGRSSHQTCSVKRSFLRNFVKFTGKHLCQSLFFNKVAGLRPTTLLRKRFWHRCFPVNFAKFLRAPFLQNSPGQMLLIWVRWVHSFSVNITLLWDFDIETVAEKIFRSSHSQMFFKKGVLKNFTKFSGRHLWWSVFLIKFLTKCLKRTRVNTIKGATWKECNKQEGATWKRTTSKKYNMKRVQHGKSVT